MQLRSDCILLDFTLLNFTRPSACLSSPDGEKSAEFIAAWAAANRDYVRDLLHKFGAVKFTGFGIRDAGEFEQVAQGLDDLSNEYRGTSPRELQPGTSAVYSASELPGFYPISQHIEMSFLPQPPKRLQFCCLNDEFTRHSPIGGETCLCDFRKVWADLPSYLKAKLEHKGVSYVRNYNSGKSAIQLDLLKLKPWPAVFGYDDKARVQAEVDSSGLTAEWGPDDSLRLSNAAGVLRVHEETGDVAFSSHIPVFSPHMMYQEFDYIYQRTGELYYLVMYMLMWLVSLGYSLFQSRFHHGMNTLYADGAPISAAEFQAVRDVIWKNLVFPAWHMGDVLFIDNQSVSHGRQPYHGKRRVLVAWSQDAQGPAPLPPTARVADFIQKGAGATGAVVEDYDAYFSGGKASKSASRARSRGKRAK